MKNLLLSLSLSILVMVACDSKKEEVEHTISLQVNNTLDVDRTNNAIRLKMEALKTSFPNSEAFAVYSDEKELPSQLVAEGPSAGLMVLIETIAESETLTLTVKAVDKDSASVFPKRTQAELSIKEGGAWKGREYLGGTFKNVDALRVPDEHTDHSWYIRYEGPGWESDLVGYRFYLDWRNATDVFGKTTEQMVLQDVGKEGFDSYHELNDWGMDVLKVGKSLGIGSPAYFSNGNAIRIDSTDSIHSKVLVNGAIYSSVKTDYYGWEVADTKLDVNSYYSIHAGSRLTHHHIDFKGEAENLATGIGKNDSAQVFSSKGSQDSFGFIATYGNQSLNNDKLGLAVLFPSAQFKEITADQYSDIVVLSPSNKSVDYYFLAAWELESDGITTQEAFLKYIEQTAKELANPLQITIETNLKSN